jgi:hypothetical protein
LVHEGQALRPKTIDNVLYGIWVRDSLLALNLRLTDTDTDTHASTSIRPLGR